MRKMNDFPLRYGLYIILTCSLWPSSLWAVDNSECFECHSDESLSKESTDNILQAAITESLYVDEDKFEKSIHNIYGITCADCHADIEELNWDEDVPDALYLERVNCVSCHKDTGEEFSNSVQMKMRTKGISAQRFHIIPNKLVLLLPRLWGIDYDSFSTTGRNHLR